MRAFPPHKAETAGDRCAGVGHVRRRWLAELLDVRASSASSTYNRIDVLLLGVISLIALAASLPFFHAANGQMPEAGDLAIHWPRMLAFDEALRSGVWVPRWLGSMNGGYGAATTLFYAPMIYYALSAAHAVTGDWPAALEAVMAFAALGSGATLYAYARTLASRGASGIAALFYVLSPYHLIDLYHRGALAELFAFVWMPLVMLAFAHVAERRRAQAIAGGALALALLVLTHPPTAYLFTVTFVAFIIFYAAQARRWQPLLNGLAIVALGGAVAAFYALPAVLEKSLVNQSITDLFRQRMGFITQLLTGNRFEQLVGAIALMMALLWGALSWLTRKRGAEDERAVARRRHLIAWILVGGLSLAMLLPLSEPLVKVLPGMAAVAFVWRWLALTTLALAALTGAAADRFIINLCRRRLQEGRESQRGDMALIHLTIVALLAIGSVVFGVIAAARASNLRMPFVAPQENYEQDFTPLGTPNVYELPRGKTCEFVDAAGGQARLIEWQPERRVIEITSPAGGLLHVYSLMYGGWAATLDGSPVAIETHPQLSTMLVEIPPGHHHLVIVFRNTKPRLIAWEISVAAGIILVMLLSGRLRMLIRRRRPIKD
jgi:6-pyruvoyl-tetrahydropterin synthase related domain